MNVEFILELDKCEYEILIINPIKWLPPFPYSGYT